MYKLEFEVGLSKMCDAIEVPIELFELLLEMRVEAPIQHKYVVANVVCMNTDKQPEDMTIQLSKGTIAHAMRDLLMKHSEDLDHMSYAGNNGWEFVEYEAMAAYYDLHFLYDYIGTWVAMWKEDDSSEGWQKGATRHIRLFCDLGRLLFGDPVERGE